MRGTFSSENFSVSDILLDLSNPRFEALNSERDALNALINDDPKKIYNLAEDILEYGLIPSELPIVQSSGSGIVVLEGNRRFATLKLLRNPELSDDVKVRTQFARLAAAKGTGPDEVLCQVVASPEDARHWIEVRHSLQVKPGVSVVPWSPEQRARFGGPSRRNQTGNAVAFCDAITDAYTGDEEMLAALTSARAKSITNIGRMVSDPDVRNALGFGWQGSGVVVHFDLEEARSGFLALLTFLATNDVNAIRMKEDRRDFLHGHAKVDLPDQRKRLDSPIPVGPVSDNSRDGEHSSDDDQLALDVDPVREESDFDPAPEPKSSVEDDGQPTNSTEPALETFGSDDGDSMRQEQQLPTAPTAVPASRTRGPRPERKIFETVNLRHVNSATKKLLEEAQSIRIDDAPRVCAIMLRVVVEIVATEVGEYCKWFPDSENLAKKITKSIKKLDPNFNIPSRRNPDLHPAYTKSDPGGNGVAVQDLNSYVHHFRTATASSDVRAHSQTFGPLVQALDNHLGQERLKQ
ncbi:hypothetical protein [Rhodococcus qingshengii]|uniref:ParB/Sulfiredoxin domain-containing protein n=1 Tax=Rhodococcus qingshengii TaxID=334542 RepID=A0A2A5J0Z2_RHOSG|nr:hypothetical protein [Rhodococcus qingshengii]PCK23254.1 hypothetical protein CHR55_30350 [Rhodococcus qingshengii]